MTYFATNQQFFNQVMLSLAAKERPCMNSSGHCVYENDSGEHCAIGDFIPEGHPAMKYEGNVDELYNDLSWLYDDLKGIIFPDTANGLYLARQLQQFHDSAHFEYPIFYRSFLHEKDRFDYARQIGRSCGLDTSIVGHLEVTLADW